MNKHYIRHDSNGFVIKGFSDAFEQPLETDICICEDGGRHFEYNGEVNPYLFCDDGCPKYKDSLKHEVTEQEHQEWLDMQPTPPKTTQEIQEENSAILWVEIQRLKGEV